MKPVDFQGSWVKLRMSSILDYIVDHPGADQENIAKYFHIPDLLASHVVDKLRNIGLVGKK
jgi:hypothetical protein